METKRAEVIMLPTEERADNSTWKPSYQIDGRIGFGDFVHNLYFITDDEIKEGDWAHNEDYGIGKVTDTSEVGSPNCHYKINNKYSWHCSGCKKIVTTTDPDLIAEGVAQPSKAFIEKYCKVGGIEEVEIEVEELSSCVNWTTESCVHVCKGCEPDIKVNSHNKITIHPIKNSWSREEVLRIASKAAHFGTTWNKEDLESWNRWIKENLK